MTLRRIEIKRETITMVYSEDVRTEMSKMVDPRGDPYQVLRRKTRALAELLNCTEKEAEDILLARTE